MKEPIRLFGWEAKHFQETEASPPTFSNAEYSEQAKLVARNVIKEMKMTKMSKYKDENI